MFQSRRTIITSGHRQLCHTLIVETKFTEIAEFVFASVIERHIIVGTGACSKQIGVGVHKAVEVAGKHKLLTAHSCRGALVFFIFGTCKQVDGIVFGNSIFICADDLSGELLAVARLE